MNTFLLFDASTMSVINT